MIVGILLKDVGVVGLKDVEGLTFIITYVCGQAFGLKVAIAIASFITIISATWFIWLGISAVLRRKIKKLEAETIGKEGGLVEPNKPIVTK